MSKEPLHHAPPTTITVEIVRQAMKCPLPGRAAQARMAPRPRPGWEREGPHAANCRLAGVLLLLYPKPAAVEGLFLVLTRRPDYGGTHGGQISLPGGGREGAESLEVTALREAYEEIGVRQGITIIGQLTPLYIPPSNYRIYPFVAYQAVPPVFRCDPREVEEILELPVCWLFDVQRRRCETRWQPGRGRFRVPFFEFDGQQVWGATAMVLAEFAAVLAAAVRGDCPSAY